MALVLALAPLSLILLTHMPTRKTPTPSFDPATHALVERLNPHAAGIDLGARQHWVCVPEGSVPDAPSGTRREPIPGHVRSFGTNTSDLRQIVQWLKQAGVDTVAMEATGVYWIPLYDHLESEGFRVLLVDPQQVKTTAGRPKTDRLDCMWIQRLHTVGMLTAAFRPDEPIRVLRSYQRQRQSLIEDQSRYILRMQKALEQMNVKLTETVADITGTTGLAIIESIVAGERDPRKLAKRRQGRCKRTQTQFALALEGTWQVEHLFALKQALEMYKTYRQQIAACDQVIEAHLGTLARPEKSKPLPSGSFPLRKQKNSPKYDARQKLYDMAGVDLTAIEGIKEGTALAVLSEIGTDMSKWPNEKAFGAWLGLAPNAKESGGKRKSARTRPGANRAAHALRVAAQSVHRSQSALGAFSRRIASRRGMPKAITATAYKLARIIYAMLKQGQEYAAKSMEGYEAEYQQRRLKQLHRTAAEMGYEVVAKKGAAAERGQS